MQKLTLKDKERFDDAYHSLKFPLAEHSFAWIYMWDSSYQDMEWTVINDNLCLFLTFEGARCVWGPVLPGSKLKDTVKKCVSLCENYSVHNNLKKQPAIRYIPEELKQDYAELEGFKLEEQNQDYIYKTENIINYPGEQYKKKRNLRNSFIKNNKILVEPYAQASHQAGCLELLNKWGEDKGLEDKKIRGEIDANKKVLSFLLIQHPNLLQRL